MGVGDWELLLCCGVSSHVILNIFRTYRTPTRRASVVTVSHSCEDESQIESHPTRQPSTARRASVVTASVHSCEDESQIEISSK